MEVPVSLQSLYRHWEFHVQTPAEPADHPVVDEHVLAEMVHFLHGRIAMWEKKVTGQAPPYTDDPILAQYRFCNIFREFDRQTIEIHTLLNPVRDDFPRWLLNMLYCRLVARPETIRAVGLLSFEAEENHRLYDRLTAAPRPKYGTPYVFPISVIQKSTTPTREKFLTEYMPTVMPAVAAEIPTWRRLSVYDGVARVLPIFGKNLHFLWTEVLIDVAYQFPQLIDLFGRFPIGPGAAPTLRRLNPSIDPTMLVQHLPNLAVETGITYHGQPLRLSAENWEGIGCEFRKYTNLRAGHGRRRLYQVRDANLSA